MIEELRHGIGRAGSRHREQRGEIEQQRDGLKSLDRIKGADCTAGTVACCEPENTNSV
jgi:hypothetical protein